MFNKILVALDGSELAEQVLPAVEELAHKFSSTVILLRATISPEEVATMARAEPAFGWPGMGVPPPSPLVNPVEITEAEMEEATSYLASVAERLRARGLTVCYDTPDERAGDAIVDQARRLGADLIAMTTHGRGGLVRLVFGSVAEHVLHHAPCPVLLVRIPQSE